MFNSGIEFLDRIMTIHCERIQIYLSNAWYEKADIAMQQLADFLTTLWYIKDDFNITDVQELWRGKLYQLQYGLIDVMYGD